MGTATGVSGGQCVLGVRIGGWGFMRIAYDTRTAYYVLRIG
jgi:hypothetical protein